jgi:hypothetical protein
VGLEEDWSILIEQSTVEESVPLSKTLVRDVGGTELGRVSF